MRRVMQVLTWVACLISVPYLAVGEEQIKASDGKLVNWAAVKELGGQLPLSKNEIGQKLIKSRSPFGQLNYTSGQLALDKDKVLLFQLPAGEADESAPSPTNIHVSECDLLIVVDIQPGQAVSTVKDYLILSTGSVIYLPRGGCSILGLYFDAASPDSSATIEVTREGLLVSEGVYVFHDPITFDEALERALDEKKSNK